MATLLFEGTLVYTSGWEEIFSGPPAGQSTTVEGLYLFNDTGATAAVELAKVVSGYRLIIFSGNILNGAAEEINNILLYENESLELTADQLISYVGYGDTTAPYRDPTKDTWFDCVRNNYQGILAVDLEIQGQPLSAHFALPENSLTIEFDLEHSISRSALFELGGNATTDEAFDLTLEMYLEGDVVVNEQRSNWVGWSKIGQATFHADLMNDAGFMPMPFKGWIYAVKQLEKNFIAYGSHGVAMLFPASSPMPTFGMQRLLQIGLKGKNAITGDHSAHFFIDSKGALWKLSGEGLAKLGYEEFLSELSNPSMHFDLFNRWVLISDANQGYILTDKGLGGGYGNLSGYIIIDGEPFAVSPDELEIDTPELTTAPIDFGYRGLKTVESVQFGLDVDQLAYAAIDYKYSKSSAYVTSQWVRLSPEGVAFIRVAGTDFRFRLKLAEPGFCEISYINIQYKRTDYRYVRSNMGAHHANHTTPA